MSTETNPQDTVMSDLTSFLSGQEDSNTEQSSDVVGEEVSNEAETEESIQEESAPSEDDTDDEATVDEESDEDDSSEDEEETDDEESRTSFDDEDFEITIDGEPITVKGSELKNGYLRHKDYTKKTQELSEERKTLNEEKTHLMEQANVVKFHSQTKLEQFNNVVQQAGGWEQLRANHSPEQVEQFTKLYVDAQKEAQQAENIIEEYSTKMRESNSKEIQNILTDMSQTFSGFNNESIKELDSYLTDNGFTPDMTLSVTHPQAWQMMYKAMLYDKAQSRSKSNKADSDKANLNKKKHYNAPIKKGSSNKSRKLDKNVENLRKSVTSNDREASQTAATNALLSYFESNNK